MKPVRYYLLKVLPLEYQVQIQRDWIRKAYAKEIEAKKVGGEPFDFVRARAGMLFELQTVDEVADYEMTQKLVRQATRLQVPVPSRKGEDCPDWYEASTVGGYNLTPDGFTKLRASIRAEKKARYEMRALLLPWLSGLTGLLGTVTGLVALILK